jgi:hypothetical protein
VPAQQIFLVLHAVLCCAAGCNFVLQLLDRHLAAAEAGGAQALGSLDSQLAETEDVLSYISDLLSLGAYTDKGHSEGGSYIPMWC